MTKEQIPLTTLLSWAWIAHTIEVDNHFEAVTAERVGRHFRISLPMWTNGLRFVDDEGVTVDELRRRARAHCNIGGLERWGWISIGDPARPRRNGYGSGRGVKDDTVLRPTRAGSYARRVWPRVVSGIEARWCERFGPGTIDQLRRALLRVVMPMPWSPPEVSPPQGFRSHVVLGDDALDGEPPLVALLGQGLTALTLEHEQGVEVSLPLGADLLRVIGREIVPLRDLPRISGLSKQAIAMAVGYLERMDLAVAESGRCVALTPDGLDALEGYRHRAAQQNDEALRDALHTVLIQRDALCAGLVPPEGCWRAARPYLAQTQRVLADPLTALPWQPMVLHRGGWPDGS